VVLESNARTVDCFEGLMLNLCKLCKESISYPVHEHKLSEGRNGRARCEVI
jgi:hypothetical protein